MAEYIERKMAIDAVKQNVPYAYHAVAITLASMVPAADITEVVRCGECERSYDDLGGLCCSYGLLVDCVVPEDFYCAYGKRRGNNADA